MDETTQENSNETGKKHTVLLTGASGYVGGMLVDLWSKRPDVKEIIALDMEEAPDFLKDRAGVFWIQANTSDKSWQETAKEKRPTVVVHAAWQIRNLYGNPKKQYKWNVEGSRDVFDFAFSTPSVKRLVYFSTASILGASPDNEVDKLFDEEAPLKDEVYLYAAEKKEVEEDLRKKVTEKARGDLEVSIIRPAAITGPRGRFARIRFGLQSALSGKLKGSLAYTLVSTLTTFVPATKKWCRQFIHEDDIADIVTLLTFNGAPRSLNIYNLAPPGPVVLPKDMGEATGKKIIILPPWLVRIAFFIVRHITLGKVPTAAGAWRFYSFPIVMDGSKITKELGYTYQHDSVSAFSKTKGRYEYCVPEELRK